MAPAGPRVRFSWRGLASLVLAELRVNQARAFLWTPVAFGLGAAGYLEARTEPPVWALGGLALLMAMIWWAVRHWNASAIVLTLASLAAFGASGGLAAKIRSDRVAAPIMAGERVVRRVDGFVVDVVSPGAGGPRLLIAPVAVSGLSPERTPRRIRVTIGENETPAPGEAVRLKAMLGPPPPPAAPGSYDFARDAWFDSIGGVGFVIGEVDVAVLNPPPWRLRLTMAVNRFRWGLAQRILAHMGPDSGGIGAAMVTGHEAWISQAQTDAMRASGLAHILSISGLHMAIVGGFVFGLARLVVAAWPWLALRAPGKKIAAVAGLVAVLGYLLISGAPPPAERSAITASVAFLAILFDRRSITLHGLAVAALLILALKPETAGEPGFQMSFAATAALVALAEAWPQPLREISTPWWIRWPQAGIAWLAASVAASLVAGLATAPFAMQHFNRVAVWGLPANLAVAPLSSFVIMPFLAVGTLLEPFGLGGPFLAVAGWGIDAMVGIANGFAAAHGAQRIVASAPPQVLVVAFLGLMILCLWRGRLRWIGAPLALAVALWPRPAPPDAWIAADGATAAVRSGDAAVLLRTDAKRFGAELWARRRGLTPATWSLYACDKRACAPALGAPVRLSIAWSRKTPDAETLSGLCMRSEVLVVRAAAPERVPPLCADTVLLTAEDFERGGAAELYRRPDGWRIVWAQPLRGDRPWSRLLTPHVTR
ncbi:MULTISPECIES: ComEC/Rec2 family competence protein [unclassified Caulobacter]|uniref:ComEC/Rec2 family competence protein n=1 Tax=unclassified Caulobacter TaxID=2648921 RepID=UPI0006FEF5E1|nr:MULTISPECIES: ComEC/Rec2 family competence protein [unclassified Caulobacter]KQV57920.1 competence protein ComEC [Caulobacter sp. Root342]KQV67454.1 competence protein ComEC [Caulobacter sp. Root343]